MNLLLSIALKHLLARKRQSIVSLLGIVLGVAFFLAISSLMQGSEKDFIRRLVDNSPHITIADEYRKPSRQPVESYYAEDCASHPSKASPPTEKCSAAIELRRVKPLTETRGIRGYAQALDYLRAIPDLKASPVLMGQGLMSYAGRDLGISLNGMVPEEIRDVSTIENYMKQGTVDDLIANPNGIVLGAARAKRFSLDLGENITIATANGQIRNFKLLGIFQTGREEYDQSMAFVSLKRVQSMLNRPKRANRIIVKLDDPYQAREIAAQIEGRIGYKSVSWQEASEDLMNTLSIRNTIMYTVVSAVLVVAAFGIYNVISTVVLEKQRDISILKSMGFTAGDVRQIFLTQGVLLGIAGCLAGIPLGCALMLGMMQIRFTPPGATEEISMPVDWTAPQFFIAIAFAMAASILAAYLPARKAAKVQPVDILRGGM
jgi:lipoprotein-releasing system permease protein